MSSQTKNSASVPVAPPKGKLVAIVGRPNVGKSSLFNRLTGRRQAIVTDEPGITRDRLYGTAAWEGKTFEVVDTGGLVPDEKATMAQEILRQARVAIEASATVVLVVDARAGVTPLDAGLARLLARTGKRVIVAANKVDNAGLEGAALAFHELGIERVIPVSAEHGLGIGDLLDELTRELAGAETGAPAAGEALNVALIGRPNVGKSTLLNRLAGDQRAIVATEPGTTRDAVDTLVPAPKEEGKWWRLVDTAGLRRKSKAKLMAEKLSVVMARRGLERADVAVLLLDTTEGVTHQDATIGGYAHESGRSVVLAVNKWDAVEKDSRSVDAWMRAVRRRLPFLSYAPVVFISAGTGQRVEKLKAVIAEVGRERWTRVSQAELREFLRELPLERASVPRRGRGPLRLHALEQVATAPPTFLIRGNLPRQRRREQGDQRGLDKPHFSLTRFLENRLRERFGFLGTPLRFKLAPRRPGRARRRKRARTRSS